MIDKIGHIKNPLTIVAIFASITEISGTAILPLIEPVSQELYVRFLMFFPTSLVAVFFFVLWHKPHVLYAPSDYADEKNFVRMLGPATVQEVEKKVKSEVDDDVVDQSGAPPPPDDGVPPFPHPEEQDTAKPDPSPETRRSAVEIYRLGEAKAFEVLADEYPNLKRDVAFATPQGRLIVDGVAEHANQLTLFEVKVSKFPSHSYVRRHATEFAGRALPIITGANNPVRLIMVVAHPPEWAKNTEMLPKAIKLGSINIEIRYVQL